MLIAHAGARPDIDPSAWIAPTAVLSGAVRIGPRTCVLHGAVLTAERGQDIVVGTECVIMENAVLRAAGRFPVRIDRRVLVGPHAHLSGCSIGPRCFIATGAMIFNGARLGDACTVALGGKVHIDTELGDDTYVPMGFIAWGRPGRLYSPDQAPAVHEQLDRLGFAQYVFGIDASGKSRAEIRDEMLTRYTHALSHHQQDRIITA
jgi:carbonic anhydrase/acetyltransferase-like protein (isoleucine patch superfamily)